MDSRTDETGTYEEDEDYSVSEGPEELFDDSVIRFFVALYDYDPTAMSPNDDAADEELTFKEGDVIKVSFIISYFIPGSVSFTVSLIGEQLFIGSRPEINLSFRKGKEKRKH